ncbi:MAG: hypothetical protein ACLP4V_26280 [Methylocella sp.]
MLEPIAGEAIPVLGRIAVFGERPDEGAGMRTAPSARAPYLAACVVGRAEDRGPVEVLSAYVHPCAGEHHLMLVEAIMNAGHCANSAIKRGWAPSAGSP